MRRLWLFFLCALTGAECGPAAIPAGEPPNLDDVRAAWEERVALVRTARFEWRTTSYRTELRPEGSRELHYTTEDQFWFGTGARRRYVAKGRQPSPYGGLMSLDNTLTDDGNGGWRAFTPPCERFDFPVGSIDAHSWGRRDLYPLLLCFGKLSGAFAVDPARLRIVDHQYPLGEGSGLLLEEERDAGQNQRRLVVDPSLGFSVVRLSVTDVAGRTDYQYEIRYQRSALGPFVPAGWTYSVFAPDGSLKTDKSSVVTQFELNPNLPDEVFTLEFPVGTVVQNEATNEQYIQLAEGRKRLVTQAERDASIPYSTALRTESGKGTQLTTAPGLAAVLWLLLAGVSVLLCCAGAWCYRRFRGSRHDRRSDNRE